jgi:4-hydroxy-3-polyprenylbenzoate decarboxylase
MMPMKDDHNQQITGPFDSMRDFIDALEARGRLIRIKELDQDKFEATALAYRLVDKFGFTGGPAFLAERVKVDGKWIEGPVVANLFGGWDTEAMGFGIDPVTHDHKAMYRATMEKLETIAATNGDFPKVAPAVVDKSTAQCKEIVLTGDDIDITQYPFLKCNPSDGGRYINAGSVIMEDPYLGRNAGTYRCQLKDKKLVAINPEKGQHGYNFLMMAKQRGEKSVKAAIVLGMDPITWTASCSKLTGMGEDEYEVAGGMLGKPLNIVPCETSEIMVPANAEMVIEGEIPLDEFIEEGPHGEMYGYLGANREANFFLNIECITHRIKPVFYNNHTGVLRGLFTAPMDVFAYLKHKQTVWMLEGAHIVGDAMGIYVISVNKRFAGDGLSAGIAVMGANFVAKVVIVVDKDVDILDKTEVLHAIATRWQPSTATVITPHARATLLEPSAPQPRVTSKAVIDATRQLPEEGGPQSFPPLSRDLFENAFPDSLGWVDEHLDEFLKNIVTE